jgi:alpha-tubulin suppressor-like RCC1 family protein
MPVWMPKPVQATSVLGAAAISLGQKHSCAILAGNLVGCWGDNSSQQLGTSVGTSSASHMVIAPLDPVTDIAAGGFHTCALQSDGAVKCWGKNNRGQLGNGSTVNSLGPVSVVW